MQLLRWMRMIGDTLLGVRAIDFGYFALDIMWQRPDKKAENISPIAEAFGTGAYQRHQRNPLQIHAELNSRTPLLETHFRRWLELFTETVDELFVGAFADLIKARADAIAKRMFHFVNKPPDKRNQ